MLAARLDNIMVDNKKIHANQPRFARESTKVDLMDISDSRIEGKKGIMEGVSSRMVTLVVLALRKGA